MKHPEKPLNKLTYKNTYNKTRLIRNLLTKGLTKILKIKRHNLKDCWGVQFLSFPSKREGYIKSP